MRSEKDARNLNIEVFDHDKIGKDKSLGKLDLNIEEVLNNDGSEENGILSKELNLENS